MTCDRIRAHAIEWADGRLPAETEGAVREHLGSCASCRAEFEGAARTLEDLDRMQPGRPAARLRAGVLAAIEAERRALRAADPPRPALRRFPLPPLVQGLAACALLALGYAAGLRHAPPVADAATRRELSELRSKVDSMGQLVGYSLLQQQGRSANDRLEGVLASASPGTPPAAAIDRLIATLALDPSANVRLNAVSALYPHADQEVVRTGILVSLPREPNPVVQLAMIDFLAASRDRDAGPVLEKLSASDTADADVRAAAQRALTQL